MSRPPARRSGRSSSPRPRLSRNRTASTRMSGWTPGLGRKAVMGGTAWVPGSIIAPGVVRQAGTYQRLIFGELDGSMSRRGQALSDACAAAGFEGDFSANVLLPVWEKFLAIVPLSSVNSLTRVPLGVYREDPELWGLCEASLRETIAVGRAEG